MKLTNKFGLPDTVVKALTRSEYSKGDSNRSVTQLIDSPRVRILRQENWENMEEDVSEKMWAVLGTAAHKMFEETGDDKHLTEERLYTEVEGWAISGAIDVQRIEDDLCLVGHPWKERMGTAVELLRLSRPSFKGCQGQGTEGHRNPARLESA